MLTLTLVTLVTAVVITATGATAAATATGAKPAVPGTGPLNRPSISIRPPAAPPAAPAAAPAGLVIRSLGVPDPFVLVDGKHDYLYAGGSGPGQIIHVPVYPFTTLSNLPAPTDAMPVLPPGTWDWIWTADVQQAGGGYVMWFTSSWLNILNPAGVANECIGVATSAGPTGPFAPQPNPVICQPWGSIDPRTFTDTNGQKYLLWKADTNADHTQAIPTPTYSQRLAPDGTTLLGTPVEIAVSTQPWEQALAESPDMVVLGEKYYLFFSGNRSASENDGIGVMACAGPQGPCDDNLPTPLLSSNLQGPGPGEESLYQQNGKTWLLYSPNFTLGFYAYRPLAVARVAYEAQGPYIAQFGGALPGTLTTSNAKSARARS